MSYNSINTNRQAVFAIQSLNQNTMELNATQKRVSTGFRVADSKDDTGAFSVAQAVRSDIAGVTAVNEQLGGARGILSTTMTSLTQISNTMQQLRTNITRLADGAISGESRDQYNEQFRMLNRQIQSFVTDATYNGRTLLSTAVTTAANATLGFGPNVIGGEIQSIRNETGGEFTIAAFDGATLTLANSLTGTATVPASAAAAQGYIQGAVTATGTNLGSIEARINRALASFGASQQFVDNQINYNTKKLDALADGLGALVDADLAKESSRMTALQTRQQLSFQTLSMANQGPQSLLSLFR
ncbi:MAG: flagellin [Roseomonas sp.]